MAIKYVSGDIFESGAEALVNPVNTVGVMGKGLALEFKKRFPQNYLEYKYACTQARIKTGRVFVTKDLFRGYIINFPTKKHWKDSSNLEDISLGIEDMIRVVHKMKIKSVAVPALGCGLGGLEWEMVKPWMEWYFLNPDLIVKGFDKLVEFIIYEPR